MSIRRYQRVTSITTSHRPIVTFGGIVLIGAVLVARHYFTSWWKSFHSVGMLRVGLSCFPVGRAPLYPLYIVMPVQYVTRIYTHNSLWSVPFPILRCPWLTRDPLGSFLVERTFLWENDCRWGILPRHTCLYCTGFKLLIVYPQVNKVPRPCAVLYEIQHALTMF